jgi:hypothetical protein
MTLKDWADLAQITLFPAILVSLVGLWFTLNDARKRAVESHKAELERARIEVEGRNAQWQKVVIYTTLEGKPLTLAEIRDKFVTKATQFGLAELGLDRISDISIHAALLDLIANKAIVRLPPVTPGIADVYTPTRLQLTDPLKTMKAVERLQLARSKQASDVRTIIEQNEGRFTEFELAQFIRTSTNLGDEVVNNLSSILGALEVQGLVGRDDVQKLSRITRIVRTRGPPMVVTPPAPPKST